MLLWFLRIQGDLVQTSETSDNNIIVDVRHSFEMKVWKSSEMFTELATTTKSQQAYGRTLGDCANDIDVIMEIFQTNRDQPESPMYQYKF